MWTIFNVFIEFVTILLLFYVFGFFGGEACGILAPLLGIEPTLPALEGEVLTTGPPGKSLKIHFKQFFRGYSLVLENDSLQNLFFSCGSKFLDFLTVIK